jgi:hypothetical protein
MRNSRLSRRLDRQSKKTLILSVVGSLAVLFVLVTYGIPFLANMSLMLAGSQNTGTEEQKKADFISTPVVDIPYTATNSAKIKVMGHSLEDHKVKLYVNDSVFDTTDVRGDNSFIFDDVELEEGENRIAARAINKDKEESDMSDEIIVVYKHKAPTLSVESPSNGQNYPKEEPRSRVTGKTDPGVKVTVNDFWAIVDPDGTFSYDLQLKGGENTIKIVATDEAGNRKEEERKVTLSQ